MMEVDECCNVEKNEPREMEGVFEGGASEEMEGAEMVEAMDCQADELEILVENMRMEKAKDVVADEAMEVE